MPRASRKTCQVQGCQYGKPDDNGLRGPYITDPECTKREEVVQDLNSHIEMTHNYDMRKDEDETKKIEARAKLIQAEAQKITAQTNATTQADVLDELDDEPTAPSTTSRTQRHLEKRENIPRPKIQENCTDSDLAFF